MKKLLGTMYRRHTFTYDSIKKPCFRKWCLMGEVSLLEDLVNNLIYKKYSFFLRGNLIYRLRSRYL